MVENLIDEFYQEKSKELVRFCEVILHHRMVNGVDAEDIVQKVVVKAWGSVISSLHIRTLWDGSMMLVRKNA